MAVWFQIAIALNVVYWAIFIYLLTRRRWNIPALAVGVFHMLFAGLISVAPIRSFLDPNYVGYGLGVIQLEGLAVTLPAALILGLALASAWVAVGKAHGRWMKLVMVGDLFFATSMGLALILDNSQNWTFQLGEYVSVTGIWGLIILLGFFTLPFVVSAIWAARRIRAGGPMNPALSNEEEHDGRPEDHGKGTNSFRYSESLV